MFSLMLFLSSGIFLGWSLGANDAANIFGTAVGTKMIRFRTAAIIGSVFVILGAVISGAGASETLGKLGAVNALPGAFTVALSAGLTVLWMTHFKLPVSTSQAIVGAIIGWNVYAQLPTDVSSLTTIVSTWVLCPVLSALFAFLMYYLFRFFISRTSWSIIRLDAYTRTALIIAGALGAYSLGANNIANVMGVFVPISPFEPSTLLFLQLNSAQKLFLLGGIAISVGIITYSKRVMETVGSGLFKLSPVAALIVVLAHSAVLFVFASEGLKAWLTSLGLPSFPLVPVSSSQAVVGAVIGIGLVKSWRNINFWVLGKIGIGWITTPIASGLSSYMLLFVMQNLFLLEVYL
ncbi:MAG TPA: inorganic phosphate transporter [Sediminispirochaeta sp.]|nr:inorganic phosphate transporter [Sediminispirochaeta sp.]